MHCFCRNSLERVVGKKCLMIFATFRAGFGSAVVGGTAQEGGERRPMGRSSELPLLVGGNAPCRANSDLVDSLISPVGCNFCHWKQARFQVG